MKFEHVRKSPGHKFTIWFNGYTKPLKDGSVVQFWRGQFTIYLKNYWPFIKVYFFF